MTIVICHVYVSVSLWFPLCSPPIDARIGVLNQPTLLLRRAGNTVFEQPQTK